MVKSEINYYIRALDKYRTYVSKEVDGDFENHYTQHNIANCDCIGSISHKTQCKHMKIRIAWENAGRPKGVYFTVDKARNVTLHTIPNQEE